MKRAILKVLIPAVAVLISQGAHAGATLASLECISASGKTKVSAIYPGDFEESGLIFAIEGRSDAYADKGLLEAREINDGRIYDEYKYAKLVKIISKDNVLDKKNPSLSLGVESEEGDRAILSLQSIPGTVKVNRTQNGSGGTLSAKIQGADPRSGSASPEITLKCEYRYEI